MGVVVCAVNGVLEAGMKEREGRRKKKGVRDRKGKGETGNAKHYNKSGVLWRECKIAGTDIVPSTRRSL